MENMHHDKGILVVGDAMLDIYHFGYVERISPEAPVPVFLETKNIKYTPGGAANVAVNISATHIPTELFSAIGKDAFGKKLNSLLKDNCIGTTHTLCLGDYQTTAKSRYIAQNNQQIIRVDLEAMPEIGEESIDREFDIIEKEIEQYGLILLSDYGKGFLTEKTSQKAISIAVKHGIPVFADVKDRNVKKYYNATLIKPNRSELEELSGMSVRTSEEVVKASMALCKRASCQYVLTTLGAEGMLLTDEKQVINEIKSFAREVYDVTGAGDTSIAYLAGAIVRGKSIEEAMNIANIAAGIQVGKVGTSVVRIEEVEEAIKGSFTKKVVVFTNGCFDILHAGHIQYLQEARALGDTLIVGINSDDSVRRLKGNGRPINSLADRMAVLLALQCVDEVIPFEEDTPLALINRIHPDVLVKGGDYNISDIVGAKEVRSYGGVVKTLDFLPGRSTSGMIEIIKTVNEE